MNNQDAKHDSKKLNVGEYLLMQALQHANQRLAQLESKCRFYFKVIIILAIVNIISISVLVLLIFTWG